MLLPFRTEFRGTCLRGFLRISTAASVGAGFFLQHKDEEPPYEEEEYKENDEEEDNMYKEDLNNIPSPITSQISAQLSFFKTLGERGQLASKLMLTYVAETAEAPTKRRKKSP